MEWARVGATEIVDEVWPEKLLKMGFSLGWGEVYKILDWQGIPQAW